MFKYPMQLYHFKLNYLQVKENTSPIIILWDNYNFLTVPAKGIKLKDKYSYLFSGLILGLITLFTGEIESLLCVTINTAILNMMLYPAFFYFARIRIYAFLQHALRYENIYFS